MDGVLTDSEPAFFTAVNDVLALYGHQIADEDYAPLIGSATPFTWGSLIERFGLPATLDQILEQYEPPLMARLRRPRPALPGARELILELRGAGYPLALCTASYMRWVEAILPAAGLAGLLDVFSTADMVPATKPDPAPYLLAAEKLCLPPEQCIAVEDSRNGLNSAIAAGCYTVQLRATATAAPPVDGARMVIQSLADFPRELLSRQT